MPFRGFQTQYFYGNYYKKQKGPGTSYQFLFKLSKCSKNLSLDIHHLVICDALFHEVFELFQKIQLVTYGSHFMTS